MTDIVERLRTDAAAWGGATHTVTGPRVEKLELEAAAEIERLRSTIAPVVPIADAILSEAPASAGYYSMFMTCDGRSLRITMDELRAIAAYGQTPLK